MTLTADLLVAATGCSLTGANVLADALRKAMDRFDISSSKQQAHFLAQMAVESGLFVHVEENLNYSADRLAAIFPKYFFLAPTPANGRLDAQAYARKSADIANVVYANRMGNGDQVSGDGFRFKGRGYIMLTGRANYTAFNAACPEVPCVSIPDALLASEYSALSAAWFWSKNGLNALADTNDVVLVSARINGGDPKRPATINGLDARKAATARALAAFA